MVPPLQSVSAHSALWGHRPDSGVTLVAPGLGRCTLTHRMCGQPGAEAATKGWGTRGRGGSVCEGLPGAAPLELRAWGASRGVEMLRDVGRCQEILLEGRSGNKGQGP